jgi:VanZ family protein
MGKFKHFLWFQVPAIAWAAAIFIQSSLSYINAPDLGFNLQDKLYHAIEYAIFGFLLRRALVFQTNQFIRENAGWLTILIGAIYAVSDEIHQFFVPGRSSDIGDVAADIVGILLIVLIYFIRKQIKHRGSQQSIVST